MRQVSENGIYHSSAGQKIENYVPPRHYSPEMIKALSASMVLIVAAIAMVTAFTAVTYAQTCSTLTGFPGFLQNVGLVAAGPCAAKGKGNVCSSAACTTSAKRPGKCRNIAPTGPANCACVESTVSSGAQ
jgi:hypothetical protein